MESHGNRGLSKPQEPDGAQGPWTPEEDEMLVMAIRLIHGKEAFPKHQKDRAAMAGPVSLRWSEIASMCQSNGCRRIAKQCRERWVNHLDPVHDRGALNPREVQYVLDWVEKNGRHWAQLGRLMKKAENQVKNQWYQEHKKRMNNSKATGSSAAAGRLSPNRLMPEPRAGVVSPMGSHSRRHSRRESTASSFSNPGMTSDAGSTVDSSPNSPYGPYHHSFSSQQQLPLPPFQGSKNISPRSSYASPIDRPYSYPSAYSPSYDHDVAVSYHPVQRSRTEGYPRRGSTSESRSSHAYDNAGYFRDQAFYPVHVRAASESYQPYAQAPLDVQEPYEGELSRQASTEGFCARQLEALNQYQRRDSFWVDKTPRQNSHQGWSSTPPPKFTIPFRPQENHQDAAPAVIPFRPQQNHQDVALAVPRRSSNPAMRIRNLLN